MENSSQDSHLRSENSVTYDSPYPLYAMAFSSSARSPPHHHRIAVGSFIEEYNNRVDIVSFDEETLTMKTNPNLSFEHPYPPTKLMFHPNPSASLRKSSDLLSATTPSNPFLSSTTARPASSVPPSLHLIGTRSILAELGLLASTLLVPFGMLREGLLKPS
ncbi:hypothetical protein CsSME_00002093 [Camellia sinensis var. sinensis]